MFFGRLSPPVCNDDVDNADVVEIETADMRICMQTTQTTLSDMSSSDADIVTENERERERE